LGYTENKKNMRIINQTIYFLYKKLRQIGIDLANQNNTQLEAMKKEIAKAGGKVEFKIEMVAKLFRSEILDFRARRGRRAKCFEAVAQLRRKAFCEV